MTFHTSTVNFELRGLARNPLILGGKIEWFRVGFAGPGSCPAMQTKTAPGVILKQITVIIRGDLCSAFRIKSNRGFLLKKHHNDGFSYFNSQF